jgi:acyl-CoA dehydrogenase
MDFSPSPAQRALCASVAEACARFDDGYWYEHDQSGEFPTDFHAAMAELGVLGVAMPEEHGGSGLGVVEAALVMHEVARSAGAMSAASAIHINIFGPQPIVEHGTDEQKRRFLPDLIAGRVKTCFGVTEPDAGLDTTAITTRAERVDGGYLVHGRKIWTTTAREAEKILLLARTETRESIAARGGKRTEGLSLFYADLDRSKVTVREIPKMGRAAVDSNEVFLDGMYVPEADRIGEEGAGFRCLLSGLNPERVLVGIEAVGVGRNALQRAADYARERVVFGRPIGQNQAIQHPLAESWIELEAAYLLCLRAASLYDRGEPCGAEANGAKYLGAEAGFRACTRAVMTHGGMGYAKEMHVERLLREVLIARLAPVSPQLALCHVAETVLGLPKSY